MLYVALSRARADLAVIATASTIARCQVPDVDRSGAELGRQGAGEVPTRESRTAEARSTRRATHLPALERFQPAGRQENPLESDHDPDNMIILGSMIMFFVG